MQTHEHLTKNLSQFAIEALECKYDDLTELNLKGFAKREYSAWCSAIYPLVFKIGVNGVATALDDRTIGLFVIMFKQLIIIGT